MKLCGYKNDGRRFGLYPAAATGAENTGREINDPVGPNACNLLGVRLCSSCISGYIWFCSGEVVIVVYFCVDFESVVVCGISMAFTLRGVGKYSPAISFFVWHA